MLKVSRFYRTSLVCCPQNYVFFDYTTKFSSKSKVGIFVKTKINNYLCPPEYPQFIISLDTKKTYSVFNSTQPNAPKGFWRKVCNFYIEGFKSMTVGKSLWVLILIKLFVIFAVLKLFFFPDILSTQYDSDTDRANAVLMHLTK